MRLTRPLWLKFTFNEVFKVLIILLLAVFLYLYYLSSANNRYHFIDPGKLDSEDVMLTVFDSKTATYYLLIEKDANKGWVILSPFSKHQWMTESK